MHVLSDDGTILQVFVGWLSCFLQKVLEETKKLINTCMSIWNSKTIPCYNL